MSSWLTTILGWLGYAPKAASTTASTPTLGVGITTDVGAVADALKAGTVLATQIQTELNTQPMIDAKVRQEKQDRLNAINRAIENGDLETLRKLSTP